MTLYVRNTWRPFNRFQAYILRVPLNAVQFPLFPETPFTSFVPNIRNERERKKRKKERNRAFHAKGKIPPNVQTDSCKSKYWNIMIVKGLFWCGRGGGVMKGGIANPLYQTPTPTEGEKEVKMKEQGSGGNDGFRRQKIWKGKPIVCRDGLKLQLIFIWKWKGAAEIVGHNTQVNANSNVPLK